MEFIRLGKTNLMVSRSALDTESLVFAVQSGILSAKEFAELLNLAYEGGVNLFNLSVLPDSASPYAHLNVLFKEVRASIKCAFLSAAKTGYDLEKDSEHALSVLQINYFDLCQICDPGFVPSADDGLYKSLKKLQNDGKVWHIGFASDDFSRSQQAVESGLYETVRFPFNFLTPEKKLRCAELCAENDVGFLADKPLAGGRIKNIPLAFGFLHRSENAVPLWKINSKEELQQILYFENKPPAIDEQFLKDLEQEKKNLLEF